MSLLRKCCFIAPLAKANDDVEKCHRNKDENNGCRNERPDKYVELFTRDISLGRERVLIAPEAAAASEEDNESGQERDRCKTDGRNPKNLHESFVSPRFYYLPINLVLDITSDRDSASASADRKWGRREPEKKTGIYFSDAARTYVWRRRPRCLRGECTASAELRCLRLGGRALLSRGLQIRHWYRLNASKHRPNLF